MIAELQHTLAEFGPLRARLADAVHGVSWRFENEGPPADLVELVRLLHAFGHPLLVEFKGAAEAALAGTLASLRQDTARMRASLEQYEEVFIHHAGTEAAVIGSHR